MSRWRFKTRPYGDGPRLVATVEPDGRIVPIGCTLEEAEAAVAAAAFCTTTTASFSVGRDEHHVPQIGDDELALWQDFISETKQRSSRIVTR